MWPDHFYTSFIFLIHSHMEVHIFNFPASSLDNIKEIIHFLSNQQK